jgi:uncharacterized protein VirK/YbjX
MNRSQTPRVASTFIGSAISHLERDGPIGLVKKVIRFGLADESLVRSIAGHWRVARVMSHRQTRILIRHFPQLLYRYVSENLARSFPKHWRREILINHYRYLEHHLRNDFFQILLSGGTEVWRGEAQYSQFSIRLSFTGQLNFDGDLLLSFFHDQDQLYQVAFTIVPGWVLGCRLDNVMLISRIQGVRDRFDAIRSATKACKDVSLPHLLVAAAQGVAEALDIGMIAGLRIEEFPYGAEAEVNIRFDYDAFWRTFVYDSAQRFYLIAVPPVEKAACQGSSAHRRRANLKRQFKAAVRDTACRRFRDDFRITPRLGATSGLAE